MVGADHADSGPAPTEPVLSTPAEAPATILTSTSTAAAAAVAAVDAGDALDPDDAEAPASTPTAAGADVDPGDAPDPDNAPEQEVVTVAAEPMTGGAAPAAPPSASGQRTSWASSRRVRRAT